MPLEIPKSPVQRLRHRASGSSILGGLPCLLALVLGLFAHSDALAQGLDRLGVTTVPAADGPHNLIPVGTVVSSGRTFSANVGHTVSSVSVQARSPDADAVVTYDPPSARTGLPETGLLPVGLTSITVTVTVTTAADPPQELKEVYVLNLTRTGATTLERLEVVESAGGTMSLTDLLEPPFDSGIRNYSVTVPPRDDGDVTQVTLTPTKSSGTAEITWDPVDAVGGGRVPAKSGSWAEPH